MHPSPAPVARGIVVRPIAVRIATGTVINLMGAAGGGAMPRGQVPAGARGTYTPTGVNLNSSTKPQTRNE